MFQRGLSPSPRAVGAMDHGASCIPACATHARPLHAHASFSRRPHPTREMMTSRDDDVSFRLRVSRSVAYGSNRLKPIRPAVARALVSFPYLSRLRQRKWMIRRGQSRKPIFSRFCSVGGPHRPPTLTTLDARDGAYRHRASKQEKRRCGGSGFILGGIDGDCGLHWQS